MQTAFYVVMEPKKDLSEKNFIKICISYGPVYPRRHTV